MPVLTFPDWETLPYDVFSPLPELVSERLLTLHRLPQLTRGVLVVPVGTLLQRLPPRDFVDGHALVLGVGDRLDLDATRERLTRSGYQCVSQVIAHGEFAVRGALLDVFPMGSQRAAAHRPVRRRGGVHPHLRPGQPALLDKLEQVRMLPAREYPFTDDEAIAGFRQRWRAAIDADPKASLIYREVSEGRMPGRHRVLPAAVLRRRPRPCSTTCRTPPWPSSTPTCATPPPTPWRASRSATSSAATTRAPAAAAARSTSDRDDLAAGSTPAPASAGSRRGARAAQGLRRACTTSTPHAAGAGHPGPRRASPRRR
jgi:hypothetical protein